MNFGTYIVPKEWPEMIPQRDWPVEHETPAWMEAEARALEEAERRKRDFDEQMFRSLQPHKTPSWVSPVSGLSETVSKASLPKLSPSQIAAFQDLVRKAKPLKRSMAILKDAITALAGGHGDPKVALHLASQALILAGRGSVAVPKLAARIAEAAQRVGKQALELAAQQAAPVAAMADWE